MASSRSSRILRFHISRWEGVSLLVRDSSRSSCLYLYCCLFHLLEIMHNTWKDGMICINENVNCRFQNAHVKKRRRHALRRTLITHPTIETTPTDKSIRFGLEKAAVVNRRRAFGSWGIAAMKELKILGCIIIRCNY